MQLSAHQHRVLLEYAATAPNEEVCGLIVGTEVVVLENVAADKATTFAMTVKDVISATDIFGSVNAVWHSHPSGNTLPSDEDMEAHPGNLPLIIVTTGEVTVHDTYKKAA